MKPSALILMTLLVLSLTAVLVKPTMAATDFGNTRTIYETGYTLKADGGADPTWLTITYPTTLAFNTTFTVSMGALTVTTLDTGQGATEVYLMNQNIRSSDSPTFALLTLSDDLRLTSGKSLDVNSGANPNIATFTYPSTIAWNTTWTQSMGALTVTTLDTGQGANELYDMDQNVLTTSSPQFANMLLTSAGTLKSASSGQPTIFTITYPATFAWNSSIAQTNVNIDSGTIDGVTLGGTLAGTPTVASAWTWSAAQTFPTLTLVGNIRFDDTGLTYMRNYGLPASTGTIVIANATQTLTGKTLTAPTLQGTVLAGTGLTMPAFIANGDITFAITAIKQSDEGQQLSIYGGGSDSSARILLGGSTWAGGVGALQLRTPDNVGAGIVRLGITGSVATATATWTGVNVVPSANNTVDLGTSSLRHANIYGVNVNYKSLVAGEGYESAIEPLPTETFFIGQAVRSYGDEKHFTSSTIYGEPVLGVIGKNPTQVVKSFTTEVRAEEKDVPNVPVVYTETIYENKTLEGKTYLTKRTENRQNHTLVDASINLMLANGTAITVPSKKLVPLYRDTDTGTHTIVSVKKKVVLRDVEVPVYSSEGSPMLGTSGTLVVRAGAPIRNNDPLIAGPGGLWYPLNAVPEKIIKTSDYMFVRAIALGNEAVIGDDDDLVLAYFG